MQSDDPTVSGRSDGGGRHEHRLFADFESVFALSSLKFDIEDGFEFNIGIEFKLETAFKLSLLLAKFEFKIGFGIEFKTGIEFKLETEFKLTFLSFNAVFELWLLLELVGVILELLMFVSNGF